MLRFGALWLAVAQLGVCVPHRSAGSLPYFVHTHPQTGEFMSPSINSTSSTSGSSTRLLWEKLETEKRICSFLEVWMTFGHKQVSQSVCTCTLQSDECHIFFISTPKKKGMSLSSTSNAKKPSQLCCYLFSHGLLEPKSSMRRSGGGASKTACFGPPIRVPLREGLTLRQLTPSASKNCAFVTTGKCPFASIPCIYIWHNRLFSPLRYDSLKSKESVCNSPSYWTKFFISANAEEGRAYCWSLNKCGTLGKDQRAEAEKDLVEEQPVKTAECKVKSLVATKELILFLSGLSLSWADPLTQIRGNDSNRISLLTLSLVFAFVCIEEGVAYTREHSEDARADNLIRRLMMPPPLMPFFKASERIVQIASGYHHCLLLSGTTSFICLLFPQ